MSILKGSFFPFLIIFFIFGTLLFPKTSALENPKETMYLDGGATLARQNGFFICFFDSKTSFEKEIELSSSSVKKPGKCVIFGETVFLPDKNFCASLSENGEVCFFGGAFFDRNGRLVFEFPPTERFLGSEKIFAAERAFLIGEEKLLMKSKNLSFVFDTKSGKGKIAFPAFPFAGAFSGLISESFGDIIL